MMTIMNANTVVLLVFGFVIWATLLNGVHIIIKNKPYSKLLKNIVLLIVELVLFSIISIWFIAPFIFIVSYYLLLFLGILTIKPKRLSKILLPILILPIGVVTWIFISLY